MNGELAATFSIVGRDQQGMLGIAVSSCVPGVGGRCAFVCESLVAIACQAYVHPYLAYDVIGLLRRGSPLPEAIDQALEADEGREWRQLGDRAAGRTSRAHRRGDGCLGGAPAGL